jgi:hypothetical protein
MMRFFGDQHRRHIRTAWTLASTALMGILLLPTLAQALDAAMQVKSGSVIVGHDITLNFIARGSGATVIFVHGSLSDLSYWQDQVVAFSKSYRAIAYSRRYNFPNQNPAVPSYSAATDADDLAAFIEGRCTWVRLQHPVECRDNVEAFFRAQMSHKHGKERILGGELACYQRLGRPIGAASALT